MATIEEIVAAQHQWDLLRATNDIHAAGRATAMKLIDTLRILAARLTDLGYPVSAMIGPPFPDVDDRVSRLTAGTGVRPPLILTLIWRTAGSVALTDIEDCAHDRFWEGHGIRRIHSDGFHISGCDDLYIDAMLWDAEDHSKGDSPEPFYYCFWPDIYEKDNCSGGGGYLLGTDSDWAPACIGVRWPQPAATRTAAEGPIDLITYARTAILECGGFPGFMGEREYEPIRTFLTRDLPTF